MAVYVDKEENQFGKMKMCHMIADTLEELHTMAEKIGMKREWFQPKSFPHYDVCKSRRSLAIGFGAIEVDRRKTVEIMRKFRETNK